MTVKAGNGEVLSCGFYYEIYEHAYFKRKLIAMRVEQEQIALPHQPIVRQHDFKIPAIQILKCGSQIECGKRQAMTRSLDDSAHLSVDEE